MVQIIKQENGTNQYYDIMCPGKCLEPEDTNSKLSNKRADLIAQFISRDWVRGKVIGDVGERNNIMQLILRRLPMYVTQINADNFDDDQLMGEYDEYDCIFALEVLEHLTNPRWFLRQLKSRLAHNGVIYISTPARPRYFWTAHHYYEIDHRHLQKWLLTPLGLEIVRWKKLRYIKHWTVYLIGIRPLLRMFRDGIRPWLMSVNNTSRIYEIRRSCD